jgi:hypothetical protein
MDMLFIVLLGIVIVGIIAMALVSRANARGGSRAKTIQGSKYSSRNSVSTAKSPYRSTAIEAGKNACEAVQAIAAQRYLVEQDDMPQLPLANCDAANCSCRYVHYTDRREDEDIRRGPANLRTQWHKQNEDTERRSSGGRRDSD